MISQRLNEEASLQDFEALNMSRRLIRSVSQKLKKKSHRGESEEMNNKRWVSFRCLTLYGRGGGCKVGAETSEEFEDPGARRRSSAGEDFRGYMKRCRTKDTTVDCFSYRVKEKFWKRSNKKSLEHKRSSQSSGMHVFLPDDVLEMCLVRLPLTSLVNARLVCKKWRILTTTSRFMQMRQEGMYQSPWLFLFGVVKDGFCSGEIHALDISLNQWHRIDAEVLKGRFLFSIASIQDDIYIIGGCSSLPNFGKMDRSTFKTHKGVLVFSPLTNSWHKTASMKYARSMPILGISEVSSDCSIIRDQQNQQDRAFPLSQVGGISDVYEDPHRLSVRHQFRNSFDESEGSLLTSIKPYKLGRQKIDYSHTKYSKRFVLIAVGGLGSWDEPLNSGEIYDSMSNKWIEIQRLPVDFGVVCSGVVCNGIFYVYSETDRIAGYSIERGYWVGIKTTPSPPRVHGYYPKLISCEGRLFMLSVSWCEGDGQIGRRNKAVRKLWELDLMHLSWSEVSIHPDAPMDWNAAFVADRNMIFGVEMFKIFGQVLEFLTMYNVSDMARNWSHIPRNHGTRNLDASSCMTKSMAVLHL